MFVTVITVHRGEAQLQQFEAPTVKDVLVVWAGKLEVPGLTDEDLTRLRGQMADFDQGPSAPFERTWKLRLDLGLDGEPEVTVIVVETNRR